MSPAEERVRVTIVPHTHWDREWYEPFSMFSERLVRMMDTLLDVAAAGFPHFHLDGQTAMIDDYLERRPERAAELEALVRQGRLSAGPWVTQMDEFLVSGESHIRNLEMGLARARELGGALEVGYMPDQFGHVGQMPQILAMQGIERAVVWRGVPKVVDRDVFLWEAPDGSHVLTQYMAFGYSNASHRGRMFDQIDDPEELAEGLEQAVARQRSFMAGDGVLVMLGHDHAGPDATFPQRLDAARRSLHGVDPGVAGLANHLAAQEVADEIPTWRGELRSSTRAHLLPNVYSARVHQKRERGRVEALLERYAEPLAALVPGFAWPAEELRRAWTLMLWNGAHDSACGCSHDRVALDVDERFAEARGISEGIVERALTSLGSRTREGGVLRWNPSPFEREGVPGLGYAVVAAGSSPLAPEPVAVVPIDGGFSIDGCEVLLLDEPDVGDLYNFCHAEPGQRPSPPRTVEVRGGDIDARWDGLRVLMHAARRGGEPFVRLEGVIRNERPDHRLRLHLRLPAPTDRSLAGSPFELVERPLVGEAGDVEAASPTWPARHVALAGGRAVLHEGVFEYEVAGGRELAVTLLRCVGLISAEALATRPWEAGPRTPTPLAQMIGETRFTVGIWRDAPEEDPAALLEGWERFALPLVEAPAAGGGDLPDPGTLLQVSAGGAQLSSVRRRGGEVEVGLWNPWIDRTLRWEVAGRSIELGPARIETVRI